MSWRIPRCGGLYGPPLSVQRSVENLYSQLTGRFSTRFSRMIKEFKERGLVALADKLQSFDDKCYAKVKAAGEVAETGGECPICVARGKAVASVKALRGSGDVVAAPPAPGPPFASPLVLLEVDGASPAPAPSPAPSPRAKTWDHKKSAPISRFVDGKRCCTRCNFYTHGFDSYDDPAATAGRAVTCAHAGAAATMTTPAGGS